MSAQMIQIRIFFACVFLSFFTSASAQEVRLQWEAREDLNILLPPSIRIYEANGLLSDRANVRGVYAVVDLRDNNLKVKAVGSNTKRQTTAEAYDEHNAILAINGGYFSSKASVSMLVSDGEIISPGPDGKRTRGAFGLVNRKPEIAWPYAVGEQHVIYKYPNPNVADTIPTGTFPSGAERWLASQIVGAGPVLIKSGKIRDTSKEEGFGGSHLKRHPRTAIGYRDENTLIMVVIDGRQKPSAGVTITELAQIMFDLGCYEAVNLDGGGSSAMIAADEVVNIPVDKPKGNRNSLRENASALVVSEMSPSDSKTIYHIDTDHSNYSESGSWETSDHINHYGVTKSHISSSPSTVETARYKLGVIKKGKYQLATWWTVPDDSLTNEAVYIIHRKKKADTIEVDQSQWSTSGKWNILGTFRLRPGDYVEVREKSNADRITTDALRLIMH